MKKSTRDNVWRGVAVLGAFAVLGLIWGCSTMESRLTDGKSFQPRPDAKEGEGIPYFLPLVKLRVTAARTNTVIMQAADGTTNGALQKVTNQTFGVTIEEMPERDAHNLCLFRFKPSGWSYDQMQIQITNGIVQSISATNDDRSLAALENLASAAAKLFSTAATGAFFSAAPDQQSVQVVFDPCDADSRKKALSKLENIGVHLNLDEIPTRDAAPATTSATTNIKATVNGIFYRPYLPYTIGWEAGNNSVMQTVYLPNDAPILHWDLNRAMFVKRTTAVSFASGVPTMLSLDKPSEVEAVTLFPLNLANQIAGIPTNILQMKFDIASKQTSLVTQSNALMAQMMTFLTNQAALNQQMINALTNRPPAAGGAAAPGNQPVVK